jgi:hypothetical protein
MVIYRTYNVKYLDKVEPNSGVINLRKNYTYSDLDEGELFYTDYGVFGIVNNKVYKICETNSTEFIGKHIHKDGIYSATSKRYIVIDEHMVELLEGELPVW